MPELTEQQITVILTAIIALSSTAIGYVFTHIQSKKAFDRQKELETIRRNWERQDIRRAYKLTIKDKRCDQAEQFITAMTEDFHEFRFQSNMLLGHIVGKALDDRIAPFGYWQYYIDKKIYSYGPVVKALSDKKHDLVSAWEKMEQAWLDMANHYNFIYNQKINLGEEIQPKEAEELGQAIWDVFGKYNVGLTEFTTKIDQIRGKGA